MAQTAAQAPRMKASYIEAYGGNEVVKVGNLPRPVPGRGELLVQVYAASINPIDWKIRSGAMKLVNKFKFPLVLGFDISGVVVGKGPDCRRDFEIGDEVFARLSHPGAFAEYVTDTEDMFARKPLNVTHPDAASLPLVTLTAYEALVERADIHSGQTILIHAGAGGVGTAAIQIAKNIGARVITTASAHNIEFLKQLGADEVIDYNKEDFEKKLRDIDFVLDTVGGDTLSKSFTVLRTGGIVISLAAIPDADGMRRAGGGALAAAIGSLANVPNRFRAWRHDVHYQYLFMQPLGETLDKIRLLVERNAIKPLVSQHFLLDGAAQAIAASEAGHVRGKVVLDIYSGPPRTATPAATAESAEPLYKEHATAATTTTTHTVPTGEAPAATTATTPPQAERATTEEISLDGKQPAEAEGARSPVQAQGS